MKPILTGTGSIRVPSRVAVALHKHVSTRTRSKSTVATIPFAIELAKVIVANMPNKDARRTTVREMVHIVVDAWLDTVYDLEDVDAIETPKTTKL